MATSVDDIREWGKANGYDVSGDRLPVGLRAAYDRRNDHPEDEPTDEPTMDFGERIEERPPAIVKESAADKMKGLASRARRGRKPALRAGKVTKPRVSVEKFVSGAWEMLARAVTPVNPPVGRVMAMQAPVAGMLLEDVVRNTIVDKALQPLARGMSGGEMALALVGPPLLVGALTARPDRANVIVPLLRQSLRSWISVAGDKLEQLQKQEEEFQDRYGKRIDEMIEYIMEPMMTPAAAYEQQGAESQ